MARTILELPLEVLLNITSWLDTPSYGQLRLVCSAMEKNTFEEFAKEFFSTKQFMITTFSLQTLLDISRHDILKKFMRKVIIGIEELAFRGGSVTTTTQLMQGVNDQNNVLAFGSLRRYLTAALRNLPNCSEIEVRDFESKTKQRDDGVWRSYGMTTWKNQGGGVRYHWTGPLENFKGMTIPTLIFNDVLTAIADSGMNCTYLGHVTRHDPNALQDAAFTLDAFQQPLVEQSLAKLKSMTLALSSAKVINWAGPPMRGNSPNLLAFFGLAKNLTRLRVNGDLIVHTDIRSNSDTLIDCVTQFVQAAPIARLELGKIAMEQATFCRLVKALRVQGKVESLTFFRVAMDDGHWHNVIEPLSTITTLKSCTFTSLFEGEDYKGDFRFNEIAFRSDTSNAHEGPSNISQSVTAGVIVSIAQPSGTTGGPTHVRSMASALADVKDGLVVKGKEWHEKHGVWYRYVDDPSDEESEEENEADGDESMSDESEEE